MVCGSAPAIASRRTVSRETPSRRASCAAVRKSAASSVSGGGGRRGAGMSAAARARASASSSSGGTGWVCVVVVVYRVRLHGRGSCRRGLAPWVILADGPGGLICARICPGTLSRRWYANTSGSIGHEGGGGRAAGPFAVPVIAADLQAPNFGSKREPGADLPRMQGPCTAVRGRLGHAGSGPGYGGQLEGASVDAARKVST